MFVLCVLAHDELPRQVEGKLLTRSPVVGPPLEKKHIRVFMLLESTSVWPLVSVEIEKRLAAVGQVKVTLMQALPRKISLNSWRAFCGLNIGALLPVHCERPLLARSQSRVRITESPQLRVGGLGFSRLRTSAIDPNMRGLHTHYAILPPSMASAESLTAAPVLPDDQYQHRQVHHRGHP